MPFAFLLAALTEVPGPRRALGQRYSMSHLLLFLVPGMSDRDPMDEVIAMHRITQQS